MTEFSRAERPSGFRLTALQRQLAAAFAAAALADFLLFDRPPGLSAPLAFAAIAGLTMLANPELWLPDRSKFAAGIMLIAGLLPGLNAPGTLQLLFAIAGIVIFCLLAQNRLRGDACVRIDTVLDLVLTGPIRLVMDLSRVRRVRRRALKGAAQVAWSVWLLPLGLGAVFVFLFVSANPLIEIWIARIDLLAFIPDPVRILFWLMALALAWPLIRMPVRRIVTGLIRPGRVTLELPSGNMFGAAAIVRSLLLFNLLFAVQTGLDLVYLWGGAALPEGMTYATYAHRGAYPLIATALLAAGFVLVAMQPGSQTESMRLVRGLVYVWTGQNVLLVISAILRLNLYVEIYSLTLMRVAALIWMMLVTVGLVLIVARIALRRSNAWLLSLNAVALVTTLYVCSFVNFPLLIAKYNVEHSREMSGRGVALDTRYLTRLGPQVIPALDLFIARVAADGGSVPAGLRGEIRALMSVHRRQMSDWRGWSIRGARLLRYLDSRKLIAFRAPQRPLSPPPTRLRRQ